LGWISGIWIVKLCFDEHVLIVDVDIDFTEAGVRHFFKKLRGTVDVVKVTVTIATDKSDGGENSFSSPFLDDADHRSIQNKSPAANGPDADEIGEKWPE
jgi:hypothetical protein